MSIQIVDIDTFLRMARWCPVVDVRSPGEFEVAHIPGAYNLPLFSDEERKQVGTTYKQVSREQAIKLGLRYFGPKMVSMIDEMERLVNPRKNGSKQVRVDSTTDESGKTVLVHCWRGGMRSAGVAWLLGLYGFKVYTLRGGYKRFRQWAHHQFATSRQFQIVGGYTGSGKTELLHALPVHGEVIIDLEGLGNHKGSSFGNIGMPPQPTQEMFENLLAMQLASVSKHSLPNANSGAVPSTNTASTTNVEEAPDFMPDNDTGVTNNEADTTTIWLEDESQRIGNLNIPLALWDQMRTAPVYFFTIPFEERLNHIVKGYGKGDKDKIISAILRIKKRLGGLETKHAINWIVEDNLKECFRILLAYYDKYYLKSLQSRSNLNELINYIDAPEVDAKTNATKLLQAVAKPPAVQTL